MPTKHTGEEGRGMKVGTWLCWLFGHKFVVNAHHFGDPEGYTSLHWHDKCIRCGINKPKLQ